MLSRAVCLDSWYSTQRTYGMPTHEFVCFVCSAASVGGVIRSLRSPTPLLLMLIWWAGIVRFARRAHRTCTLSSPQLGKKMYCERISAFIVVMRRTAMLVVEYARLDSYMTTSHNQLTHDKCFRCEHGAQPFTKTSPMGLRPASMRLLREKPKLDSHSWPNYCCFVRFTFEFWFRRFVLHIARTRNKKRSLFAVRWFRWANGSKYARPPHCYTVLRTNNDTCSLLYQMPICTP